MGNICNACKERAVSIKKRGLCDRCYQRWYAREVKNKGTKVFTATSAIRPQILHLSEMNFSRDFFKHKNWIYQPATFRFNGDVYTPDFYDGERNVFIEVTASNQAFYKNLAKYREFAKTYPLINFEVRQIDGSLVDISQEHFSIKS